MRIQKREPDTKIAASLRDQPPTAVDSRRFRELSTCQQRPTAGKGGRCARCKRLRRRECDSEMVRKQRARVMGQRSIRKTQI
jgi:hypothetical protein